MLAPAHVDAARDFLRERHMVVPLDVHGDRLARLEDDEGFHGARPPGHPLRRVAGALVGDHQEMIHLGALHDFCKRRAAPDIFRVGKTRVLLLRDRDQSFFAPEALTTGAQRRTSDSTNA
jgi:hypothetical protein